jgi:hypothetical protein
MSFRTIFEDPRRDEAKFFLIILEYMDYFEELHETVEYSVHKINEEMYTTQREVVINTQVITVF